MAKSGGSQKKSLDFFVLLGVHLHAGDVAQTLDTFQNIVLNVAGCRTLASFDNEFRRFEHSGLFLNLGF